MKYDDLEKTEELFDRTKDVPIPIDNIEMEGASKDTLTSDLNLKENIDKDSLESAKKDQEETKDKNKKNKKSLKEIWNSFDKRKKIITITGIVVFIIILFVLIYVLIFKRDNKEKEIDKDPAVMIEKENYIYKDGNLILLDSKEKEIGSYECKNKSQELCFVAMFSDEDQFDVEKNVYEDESIISKRSPIFLDKYVFIYDNSKKEGGSVILYNIEKKQNEGSYSLVKGFSDSNYVILKDNNEKYGAILLTEDNIEEKIEFSYEYLGRMTKDSNIVVKNSKKYYLYDEDGKALSKASSYEIKSYNKGYYVTSDDDKYQVYDLNGNLVLSDTYEYIRLYDQFIAVVKNDELWIRDYKDNKYMEEGIKLGNTYYNTLNVYNDKLEKIEVKEAFAITTNNDEIEISYKVRNKEKTQIINIKEATLNSSLKYMSYFDGKLYFYKDEDKKELLGSYECNNKNTDKLSNCYVASESFYSKNELETDNSNNVGVIPIFNDRYVFIMDTIDAKNPTIVLYDLNSKKTLSKYVSVDAGYYSKETNITFKSTISQLVMAKNKSNKYGMIEIGKEVKSVIPFNYISLEKFGDYYLAKDSANTYLLLNEKGEEVTSKYGYKIVNYNGNYLTVTDNTKYYVYDFKGNIIDEAGYLYIKMESDYYVVINSNNELDIHKYNQPEFSLEQPIPIKSKNYKNAFSVSKTENTFIVKINDESKTYEYSLDTGKNLELSNGEEEQQ